MTPIELGEPMNALLTRPTTRRLLWSSNSAIRATADPAPSGRFGQFLIATMVCFAIPAQADQVWNDAKSYTATLADTGAKTAAALAAAAAAAMKLAQQDLANAKAALAAAQTLAAGTAAAAAVAEAATAVTSATATAAAAEAAAGVTLAVATGVVGGTAVGQGANWLASCAWDPVCHLSSASPLGFIYQPLNQGQLISFLPTITQTAVGQTLSATDFAQAGNAGVLAQNFITQGTQLYLGLAQGAAAFTAGQPAQVLAAVADLKAELHSYNDTIGNFAGVLGQTQLATLANLPSIRASFDAAVAAARAQAVNLGGAQGAAIIAALDQATSAFNTAQSAVSGLNMPSSFVGGTNPAFSVLTLQQFQSFLAGAALNGVAGLPPEEVLLADLLLQLSNTSLLGAVSAGPSIAAFDGAGDVGGRESFLFLASGGQLNVAQLLFASSTALSSSGSWLNIDLDQSPLTVASVPEPESIGMLLLGVLGIIGYTKSKGRQASPSAR